MQVKKRLADGLSKMLESEIEASDIEIPEDLSHGDYATTVAMQEASEHGKDPRDFAEEIASDFPVEDFEMLEKVEVAGPGYINFFLEREKHSRQVLEEVQELDFEEKEDKVLVEHTSPNPNKPLHMGTMRTSILGDTIARLAKRLGYQNEILNYINDLGRQSARTVYAYQNFLEDIADEDMEKKPDFWIGLLYSEAGEHLEENPEDEEKVQDIIQNIEARGTEDFELMEELVGKSLHGQLETAYRANVFYDLISFESDIVNSGLFKEAFEQLKQLESVYEVEEGEDKGCLVINLSDYEDEMGGMKKPYKILKRSDGTATYTAKDIAFTMWKFGLIESDFLYSEFDEQPNGETLWSTGGEEEKKFGDADTVINVIGSPQKYPMKVIKYSLKALGFEEEAEMFDHMHFKFVYLPGRVAYSGRKGNWVGKHADAVLDRAEELALEEVEERHEDMGEEKQQDIAEKVAVAAVRYFIMKFSREKEIHFSFDKALDWEGDSGPYLLYATARAHGILKKSEGKGEFTRFENDVEYRLARDIERFRDVLEESFDSREPAYLVNYLKDLAETFNKFYHHSPVLSADDEELKRSRLALVESYASVMEEGLKLLGIEPLEEM